MQALATDSPLGFCPLAHSVMEKLKNLCMNVSWLLSFILPLLGAPGY